MSHVVRHMSHNRYVQVQNMRNVIKTSSVMDLYK